MRCGSVLCLSYTPSVPALKYQFFFGNLRLLIAISAYSKGFRGPYGYILVHISPIGPNFGYVVTTRTAR